jgi:PadR family transcriptional regulator PadR
MTTERELMAASTSVLVLAALDAEPSYGYALVKHLGDNAQNLFEWSEGTIYPVLHRLQGEGLVRAQWQDADEVAGLKGPRRRRYYYITAKGRRALAEQVQQWNAFHRIIQRMTGGRHGAIAKPAV